MREVILVTDKAEKLRVAAETGLPLSKVLTYRQVLAYGALRGKVLDRVYYTPTLFDKHRSRRVLEAAVPTVCSTGGHVLPIEFREEEQGNGREQEQ